jgi:hypothetical protein
MAILKSGRDSAVVLAELATAQANLAAVDLVTFKYTNSITTTSPISVGYVSSAANTLWAAVTQCAQLVDELNGTGQWASPALWPWGGYI